MAADANEMRCRRWSLWGWPTPKIRSYTSLDLAQAFDRLKPEKAVALMPHQGLDRGLGQKLLTFWTSQQRFLHFAGNCRREPVAVDASLPQGCPMSPWAMNVILACSLHIIERQEPRATHVVFMDDRSFATSTVAQTKAVLRLWRTHSSQLGLKEILEKKAEEKENGTEWRFWTRSPCHWLFDRFRSFFCPG